MERRMVAVHSDPRGRVELELEAVEQGQGVLQQAYGWPGVMLAAVQQSGGAMQHSPNPRSPVQES